MEEAARARRVAEDGVDDCQVRLKHYQEQISSVRTQREYGALLKEIDVTKEEIKGPRRERNGRLGKARGGRESGRLNCAQPSPIWIAAIRKAQTQWETEKPAVAQRADGLRERIEALRGRLNRGDLSLFQRLYDRHAGEALASIRKADRVGVSRSFYHCSACNFRVRPQVVVQIRNQGTVVLCDSCKRILHFSDEEPSLIDPSAWTAR